MKKTLIITTAIILITAFAVESGMLNALIMFVLMGQIPGTSYSVPASVMLVLLGITITLMIVRFITAKTRHTVTIRRLVKKHLAHKARMPRRRFGEI